MKHIIYCISLLLVTALATACSDDFSKDNGFMPAKRPYYLHTSENNFSFPATASSVTFEIKSSDTPWKFEGQAPWVSLIPESGNTDAAVTLEATANRSVDESRVSVFNLLSTDEDFDCNINMSVTQQAAGPSIELSQSTIHCTAARIVQTIEVDANVDWTVSENLMWVSAERKGSKIEITVDENRNDIYGRNGRVYVQGGGYQTYFIVEQDAPNITCETSSIEVDNKASTVQLTVHSDVGWWAKTSASWIEVPPEDNVAGETVLTVNIAANDNVNERTGYVYLQSGPDKKISIPVHQKGLHLSADVTSLWFEASGGTQSVNISSNTSWEVTNYPDWIKPSVTFGEGDAELTLTAYDNPYTLSRSGYVLLKQEGLDLEVSIQVTQTGKIFEVGTHVLEFSDKAESKTVDIQTEGNWQAATTNDWISLSPVSGTGNGKLTVNVSENTYDDERTGSATITMGNKSEEITVRQAGKYFTVSDESLQIGSTGGSVGVTVFTNDSWTAAFDGETAPDWLTLSPASGKEMAEITVTATDNPSVNTRSAALIIQTPHGQSVRVIIRQAARYLSVSASRIMLLSKGGTTSVIEVKTDGKYKVETESDWFTVASVEGGFTVSAGANTTENNRMGNIIVSLTDLKEGSLQLVIPVVQTVSGATFLKSGYETDKDWSFKNGSLTLTLNKFGTDEDWNQGAEGTLKVVKTGYTDDHNWNNTNYGSGNINRTDFGKDENHDKAHGKGGTLNRDGYGNDQDWTPTEE